jgi:hypothetical protein
MARNAPLIWFSFALCAMLPAFAQEPDQIIRQLELKRSDAVAILELEPFVALA